MGWVKKGQHSRTNILSSIWCTHTSKHLSTCLFLRSEIFSFVNLFVQCTTSKQFFFFNENENFNARKFVFSDVLFFIFAGGFCREKKSNKQPEWKDTKQRAQLRRFQINDIINCDDNIRRRWLLYFSFVSCFNWKTVTLEGKIFSAVNSFLTASTKEIRQLMVRVQKMYAKYNFLFVFIVWSARLKIL